MRAKLILVCLKVLKRSRSLLVVAVCMDPCIHVVLIVGGSIYSVSTLNEYCVLSYPFIIFNFLKKLFFYFLTNVLSVNVQTNEWFCWLNAIEL